MALALGKTLAELEHVGLEEMWGWQAFYQLEPWGCEADDHRAELMLQLTYGVHQSKRGRIPRFIDRDPQPTPPPANDDEMAARVREAFCGFEVIKRPASRGRKASPPAK